MFTLARLILLNLLWAAISIWAVWQVFGFTTLFMLIVWAAIEIAIIYRPITQLFLERSTRAELDR